MAMQFASKRWQDQLMVLVGVWLFVSPWVLGYPPDSPPAMNACIAGALIAGIATIVLGVWELRSDPELHAQWTKSRATG